MKVVNHWPKLIRFVGLLVGLSLFVWPEQPVVAQLHPNTVSHFSMASSRLPDDSACLHLPATLRQSGCRGEFLWFVIKQWLGTHLRWDTSHWGLPLYVEFDDTNRWQRLSLLCLHLSRRRL